MTEQSLKLLRKKIELTGYSNYRLYLEDLYQLAKESFTKYSYLRFAEDLGLGANNIAFSIIKGKRKLMFKHVNNVGNALGFDAGERKFFASLVRLQNAEHIGDHSEDYDALLGVAGHRQKNDHARNTLLFFSAWHHVLVFESLELFPQGVTPQNLIKDFRVPISLSDLRESLELLKHMQLVDENEGLYTKREKNLSTGSLVPGYGVVRFHLKMLELARECLSHEFSADERNVSSVTLAVSEAGQKKIQALLEEYRKKIFAIADDSAEADRVIQVNFQAFPLMNRTDTSGSKS